MSNAIASLGVQGLSSAPAAPNVTSSTCTVNYTLIGNTYYWYLTGTITLPSSRALIASIVIAIVGVDPASVTLNAPSAGFGSTGAFQTPNYAMPLTSETLTVDFNVVSASGAGTASPYSLTVTVTPTTISSLAITEVGPRNSVDSTTSIGVTPTLANTNGLQYVTFWYSWDGGTTLYWYGVFAFYPGVTTSIDISFIIRTITQAGGLTSNNFKAYAVVGAQPGNASTSTTFSALSSLYPGVVTSNAITVLPSAPSSSAASATVTNNTGFAPTPADIYMGPNSAQAPYWVVYINLQTAGASDPNAFAYNIGIIWTDASGTPISPGGQSNPYGWQFLDGDIQNDGGLNQSSIVGNYPSPGVDGYMTIQIWAANLNTADGSGGGLSVPPFTGNSGQVLQACFPGAATFYRVHVGPPPPTMTGNGLSNVPSLANPTGAPAVANQNVGTSLVGDWQFAFDALGATATAFALSPWEFQNLGVSSVTIKNDGSGSTAGIANYAALVGPQSLVEQSIPIPSGQAFYFAYSARSNNPNINIVAAVGAGGTGSGYTNGTYTGIALNGVGGTGATCTVVITGNVGVATLTANGTGYTAGTSFVVNITAGGGTGITVTAYTGSNAMAMSITATNSLGVIVNINGNPTNYFNVAGPVSSWEITAASGTLLMPANVAKLIVQIQPDFNVPPTMEWDVTNIVIQPVQNQTIGGQINSQVPQNQTSGMSVVSAQEAATTAFSQYGLQYMQLEDASSGQAVLFVGGPTGAGTLLLEAGSSASASLLASPTSSGTATLQMEGDGGTNSIVMEVSSAGVLIAINGHSGFNGTVSTSGGTKNVVEGIIQS
jgi:hypothetical protein